MMDHDSIFDNGTYFEIVPNTRKVIVPVEYKTIGTVGEHFAEQLTFKCPKEIDRHDVGKCTKKYITWKNVNGDVGHDELKIANEDEKSIYFAWTISDGITVGKGIVSFSVHFEDVDGNDRIIYRWGTTICDECEILDSINAVLNAYEAIYVSGDTLVFANYTAVKDGTLELKTDGLIPEGTMNISSNGNYDVGKFASVNVAVNPPSGTVRITDNGEYDVSNVAKANVELIYDPQIAVSSDGKVTAVAKDKTAEVQLSSEHDPNFLPENIKEGANIFGVTGSLKALEYIEGTIDFSYVDSKYDDVLSYSVYYLAPKMNGNNEFECKTWLSSSSRKKLTANILHDSLVCIRVGSSGTVASIPNMIFSASSLAGVSAVSANANMYCFQAKVLSATNSFNLTVRNQN